MGKITSTAMKIKAYSVPLILFMGAMFYQLYVIPNSYPTSHYDILGVRLHASIMEVEEAYKKLSPMWNSDMEVPSSLEFIKIQYAYELLTNTIWKRNYDIFRVEEQSHVIKEATQQYAKERFSSIPLPLLAGASVQGEQDLKTIDFKGFQDLLQDAQPLLILVYSNGSSCCSHLDGIWKRTVALLDGVANTAAVELGEAQLAAYLAEKRPTGQPFFRNGLPSLVAFPPGCKTTKCLLRFDGQFSVDAVTDWVATSILGLPRIPYYSRETLAKNFIAKTSPHKVKVIFLSKTGERATPFVRLAAMNYQAHASFAFVLWREEESSFWWNSLEVESAPALAFLKDPGVKPVVHHGPANNSWFLTLMEQNKYQELPQLRPATSLELGCDARGYSRAGVDTTSWYCVVLAGRLSNELNQMRGTMCRIQETLSNGGPVKSDDEDQSSSVPAAATALKKRRLSFAWLNGETQKNYCLFYLQSETVYETCGPRKDISDVPRLFIVRYKRNASEEENLQIKKTPKSPWNEFLNQDVDPASQLVARYNGSNEIPEIIEWISNIIKDGDSRDLPFFRTRTPELVPEGDVSMFSGGVRGVLSKSLGLKQKLVRFVMGISDDLGDPRIGPILLLLSLLSFGSVWFRRSQPDQSKSSQPKEEADQKPISKEEARKRRKEQERTAWDKARPTSITDEEPKNARQVEFSDSDSD